MCSITESVFASRFTPGLVLRISELAATRMTPAPYAGRDEKRRTAARKENAP